MDRSSVRVCRVEVELSLHRRLVRTCRVPVCFGEHAGCWMKKKTHSILQMWNKELDLWVALQERQESHNRPIQFIWQSFIQFMIERCCLCGVTAFNLMPFCIMRQSDIITKKLKRDKESHRKCFTFFLAQPFAVLLLPSSHTLTETSRQSQTLVSRQGGEKKKSKLLCRAPDFFFFYYYYLRSYLRLSTGEKKNNSAALAQCAFSAARSCLDDQTALCLVCIWRACDLAYTCLTGTRFIEDAALIYVETGHPVICKHT